MKILVATLLFALSLNISAQNNLDDLNGKWKFEDVYEKEKLDSIGIVMKDKFFRSMTFQFNADSTYKVFIMTMNVEGEWLSENKKDIMMTSSTGKVSKMEIVKLTPDTLIVRMKKSAFIMTKVKEEKAAE